MADSYVNDTQSSLVVMSMKKLLLIIACGALAGLVSWGLMIVLDTYIYKTILCNNDTAAQCASSHQYATITAMIIGAAVGLFGLVRLHVFRPLLIVIASFVALWGLLTLVQPLNWHGEGLAMAGLYALAFGLFGWFARIKRFYIAIILVILGIVALRLILNS
ncbi:MAG TPA: hypothetical protein VGO98_02350 [Candidatus Saccharimonadales bacterium]|jgi:hypothetical protein|nr:hypothetical protein [Candidatus Saccharimonadales bacterium]